MKIAVIGGSITGCAAAAAALRKGYSVDVYEKEGELRPQGAGLSLPKELVETLKKEELIPELQTLHLSKRFFIARDSKQSAEGKIIWEQPVSGETVHWSELYKKLRKNKFRK